MAVSGLGVTSAVALGVGEGISEGITGDSGLAVASIDGSGVAVNSGESEGETDSDRVGSAVTEG